MFQPKFPTCIDSGLKDQLLAMESILISMYNKRCLHICLSGH